ncbi:MAG TPA: phosphoadenosine phosphosulfate reductase family protein [Gammaproteobacteria bacterium]|nr:phosphoadenosine phosphosulfate reductase family protein [Gammaproteobacteria bacterium]
MPQRRHEPVRGLPAAGDLHAVNLELAGKAPEAIAAWALERAARPIVTTSFGVHAAAMLHLVMRIRTDVPVVWIDTGFNTPDTYRHAELLTRALRLDLRVYAPDLTRARVEASPGGVPTPEDSGRHQSFTADVKLRPFERALKALEPDVWLSGIRAEETDWRRQQRAITRGPGGILKVSPFLSVTEAEVETYMRRFSLPFGDPLHYDPVKARPNRECGLHARWNAAPA